MLADLDRIYSNYLPMISIIRLQIIIWEYFIALYKYINNPHGNIGFSFFLHESSIVRIGQIDGFSIHFELRPKFISISIFSHSNEHCKNILHYNESQIFKLKLNRFKDSECWNDDWYHITFCFRPKFYSLIIPVTKCNRIVKTLFDWSHFVQCIAMSEIPRASSISESSISIFFYCNCYCNRYNVFKSTYRHLIHASLTKIEIFPACNSLHCSFSDVIYTKSNSCETIIKCSMYIYFHFINWYHDVFLFCPSFSINVITFLLDEAKSEFNGFSLVWQQHQHQVFERTIIIVVFFVQFAFWHYFYCCFYFRTCTMCFCIHKYLSRICQIGFSIILSTSYM